MNSRYLTTLTLLAVALLSLGSIGCNSTKPSMQFATPDDAEQSFISALRAKDRPQLLKMFGAAALEEMNSGDEVADQQMRERFLKAYDEKHQLIRSSDDQIVVLQVGQNDWPLPLPIVKDPKTNMWRFDADAGIEEIVNRRIGQNELDVIEVCQAIVDAQREYAASDPDGDGIAEYARKIMSDPGKRNGLYWETQPDERPSPLGPLVADAMAEGYGKNRSAGDTAPRPYHGYYYRLLRSQGAHAQGGARDYELNGRMIGGFGVVAYPADYGDSGIMTFMVNQDGVVYQKDLGDQTERHAKSMTSLDPDGSWVRADASETKAGNDKP